MHLLFSGDDDDKTIVEKVNKTLVLIVADFKTLANKIAPKTVEEQLFFKTMQNKLSRSSPPAVLVTLTNAMANVTAVTDDIAKGTINEDQVLNPFNGMFNLIFQMIVYNIIINSYFFNMIVVYNRGCILKL